MSDSRMAGEDALAFDHHGVAPLLAGYRPLPGVFDEMIDRSGRVRGHWQPLLALMLILILLVLWMALPPSKAKASVLIVLSESLLLHLDVNLDGVVKDRIELALDQLIGKCFCETALRAP